MCLEVEEENEVKLKDKKKFYNFKIDGPIKEKVKKIIVFTSDDEESQGKESAKIIKEKLDAKIISLKNHGHYTLEDMKTREFLELLEEVLK